MYDKRQRILVELYDTKFIDNFTKTFCKANDIENLQDEIQEIYLIACEIPEERLFKMYDEDGINGVRRFLAGVIHRQMNSTTSMIHSKYRKRLANTFSTNDLTTEDLEEGFNKLDNMYKE